MSDNGGGFLGFIKRLFGFGRRAGSSVSIGGSGPDEIDDLLEPDDPYDESRTQRQAREMIAASLEAEKIDPDDPHVFLQRATGYSILDDNETALELLDKAISLDAGFIDAYRLKADIFDQQENYREIVNCLNRAISLHGAETSLSRDDYAGEIAELMIEARKDEEVSDFHHRATAYLNLEEFDAAIADFSKAIELEPTRDYLYSRRADAYLETGDAEKALEDLNKALDLEENEYNYATRARIYRERGDFETALRDISKAIAINQAGASELASYFYGHFDRGEIHFEKGDYSAAVEDFTVEIEKDPLFIEAYEKRAAAYRRAGSESLALADERKADELSEQLEKSDYTDDSRDFS